MKMTLIQGDCLKVMKDIPDKSVDLVLTDPPYGKMWARGKHGIGRIKKVNEKRENVKWDNKTPPKRCFDEMFRVSHNQIIFGGNYFWEHLKATNCFLIWDKIGNFKRGKQIPFAHVEMAWTSFNKTAKKYTCVSQGFVTDVKEPRFHPTQKPLKVIKEIIEDFTEVGDTILDPFLGSGTTMKACLETGRNCIGIEIEPKYIKIVKKRLNWGSSLSPNIEWELRGWKK